MDQYNSLVFSMLEQEDAELAASMRREFDRQQHNIVLIASENIVQFLPEENTAATHCTLRVKQHAKKDGRLPSFLPVI